MYKNNEELKNKNTEVFKKIENIFERLHDKDTGFDTLFKKVVNKIDEFIVRDENNKPHKLYGYMLSKYSKDEVSTYVRYRIIQQIKAWEQDKKIHAQSDLTDAQFEDFVNELVTKTGGIKDFFESIVHTQYKGNLLPEEQDYDEMRASLSVPVLHKYHIYNGCNDAARLFAYENKLLGNDGIDSKKIKIIVSTCWDALDTGSAGHVVPCVQMQDGNWYAFDPQTSKPIFILSDLAQGNMINHLLSYFYGRPCMITTEMFAPEDYSERYPNWGDFINKDSKVKYNSAKEFLEKPDVQFAIGVLPYLQSADKMSNQDKEIVKAELLKYADSKDAKQKYGQDVDKLKHGIDMYLNNVEQLDERVLEKIYKDIKIIIPAVQNRLTNKETITELGASAAKKYLSDWYEKIMNSAASKIESKINKQNIIQYNIFDNGKTVL